MRTTPDPARSGGAGPRFVLFTDLDGTLLSHDTYEWEAARPALAELERRGVPVVIASSKTRAEIEAWRQRLANRDPFISENGGALYVPPGSTPRSVPDGLPFGAYVRVEFGVSYHELRAALPLLGWELGVELRGFGDMETAEIARLTGLAGDDLDRARQREYDEPFLPIRPLSDAEQKRLAELAASRFLVVTRGGRFMHLTGPNSKGVAARLLLECYAAAGVDIAPVISIGLGDGPNDLDLLQAVNRPIVVARADGTHSPELRRALPGASFTTAAGPLGFTEGVLECLGPAASHTERPAGSGSGAAGDRDRR